MRIHPEMPIAVLVQVSPSQEAMGRHFAVCIGERHLCPFDQEHINEGKFCRTKCAWRKRGEDK